MRGRSRAEADGDFRLCRLTELRLEAVEVFAPCLGQGVSNTRRFFEKRGLKAKLGSTMIHLLIEAPHRKAARRAIS